MWVYLYQNNSELAMKNAYIWEVWTPWANTVAYYEFDWNLNDSSGNNKNLSLYSWTASYWTTSGGAKYINFPNTCWTTYWEDTISYGGTTLSFWYKWNSGYDAKPIIEIWASGYDIYGRISGDVTFEYFTSWPFPSYSAWSNWHYYTVVRDGNNNSKIYVDWQLVANGNWTWSWTRAVRFRFNQYGDSNTSSNCNTWNLSEVIFESRDRTVTELQHYYNLTKSNYGL